MERIPNGPEAKDYSQYLERCTVDTADPLASALCSFFGGEYLVLFPVTGPKHTWDIFQKYIYLGIFSIPS